MDFKNVPSSQSITTYNNVVITETKELMSNEVDNMLQSSKNIIDSVPYHNSVIKSCEEILKDLNPRFAKEKERDEDISNLIKSIWEGDPDADTNDEDVINSIIKSVWGD